MFLIIGLKLIKYNWHQNQYHRYSLLILRDQLCKVDKVIFIQDKVKIIRDKIRNNCLKLKRNLMAFNVEVSIFLNQKVSLVTEKVSSRNIDCILSIIYQLITLLNFHLSTMKTCPNLVIMLSKLCTSLKLKCIHKDLFFMQMEGMIKCMEILLCSKFKLVRNFIINKSNLIKNSYHQNKKF